MFDGSFRVFDIVNGNALHGNDSNLFARVSRLKNLFIYHILFLSSPEVLTTSKRNVVTVFVECSLMLVTHVTLLKVN